MDEVLKGLWAVIDDRRSTSAQVWEAWTRIRAIMSEMADA
jgi:hypothetical protein